MKNIIEGPKERRREQYYITDCPLCGATYTFTDSDTTKGPKRGLSFGFSSKTYIECPACNKEYRLIQGRLCDDREGTNPHVQVIFQ